MTGFIQTDRKLKAHRHREYPKSFQREAYFRLAEQFFSGWKSLASTCLLRWLCVIIYLAYTWLKTHWAILSIFKGVVYLESNTGFCKCKCTHHLQIVYFTCFETSIFVCFIPFCYHFLWRCKVKWQHKMLCY